jgi:antitoxin component of MazEF toxin-antitoxin module
MSKALSRHSNIRQSGNSLVVTIPVDIVRELDLNDGDSVFWSSDEKFLTLHIIKLDNIAPEGHLKKEVESS